MPTGQAWFSFPYSSLCADHSTVGPGTFDSDSLPHSFYLVPLGLVLKVASQEIGRPVVPTRTIPSAASIYWRNVSARANLLLPVLDIR